MRLKSLNIAAFVCFVLAVSTVQISYIFNGIRFLDLGVLLLIPSFLLFIIWLFQEWTTESKDYCVGLTLFICAVTVALLLKYKFQVGTIDDSYHTIRTIACSIQNSFYSKFQILRPDVRYYLIDFVEDIWGVAWRFIHWDYIIVLIQILPVFVLWRQLVEFFRNRGVEEVSGFLSTVIILSMQIIWAQACSTYVDSITGMIAALTLLRISDLLSFPQSRSFYNITVCAFLSVLCLLPKPSLVFLAIFGLAISLWFALTRLSKKEIFITILTFLASLGYCVKHYYCVWLSQGTPFYPWFGTKTYGAAVGSGAHGLLPGHYMVKTFWHIKPVYVFMSWLLDYRLGFVTPSPDDVGNGLLWTYLAVPILILALIMSVLRIPQIKGFHPSVILLIFIVLYYYFMDASVVARFMLGFNIFIMAWCFAWILRKIKSKGWVIPQWLSMIISCLVLALSLLSFFQAIKGAVLEYKVVSVMEAQRQFFPKYINVGAFQEQFCVNFLKKYKGQTVSDNLEYLFNECKTEGYKHPIKGKDLKIRIIDYPGTYF